MRTILQVAVLLLVCAARPGAATIYYVRQTTGDDARDGTSPATAWRHVDRLSRAMHAGDTAYVGPGLYREEIVVENEGAADARMVFVADTTGQHTGDPPGAVMLTGADPVDENIFTPAGSPASTRPRCRSACGARSRWTVPSSATAARAKRRST